MNMFRRIRLIAAREFLVTVSSKGFLFGVLVVPVLLVLFVMLMPRLLNQGSGAPLNVDVALIDRSGALLDTLRGELAPQAIRARRDANRREVTQQLGAAGGMAADAALPASTPTFTVRSLPAEDTVTAHRAWLTGAGADRERRALLVIPDAAVHRTGTPGYQSYELYAPRTLPEDAEGLLHTAVRQALVTERLRGSGLDPDLVRAATTVARASVSVVSADGRQQGPQGLNRALPFIMGALLFMGVMVGGQALLTSTVEEKSSRVIEVLLAAVSPLELMWGKLLGQLGVGLVMTGVYVVLGVLVLLQFAMFGLIDPMLIVYLFLFFLVAYLVFGAVMMAIGAAVNQMADAQSMMGPVMMVMMLPYFLTPVVGRAPESTFAVVSSFIPPVSSFTMLARLASATPPPAWQVLLSLLAGLAGAVIAVWFAAKIFRVGLLMHGKPPNFATLVRWARMG